MSLTIFVCNIVFFLNQFSVSWPLFLKNFFSIIFVYCAVCCTLPKWKKASQQAFRQDLHATQKSNFLGVSKTQKKERRVFSEASVPVLVVYFRQWAPGNAFSTGGSSNKSLLTADVKNRKLIGVTREPMEQAMKSFNIPVSVLCKRNNTILDILVGKKETAGKLSENLLTTKSVWLQTKYMGPRKTNITFHSVYGHNRWASGGLFQPF